MHNADLRRWIAIVLLTIIVGGGMFLAIRPMNVEAMSYRNFTLDEGHTPGAWLQGFTTTDQAMYFYDDRRISKASGTVTTYFDFNELKDDLRPYKLDTNTSLFSFLLGHMEFKGEDLYVSGLIFRDAQHERRRRGAKRVLGETYTLLFKVSPDGTHDILHLSLSKTHTIYLGAYDLYDNVTGMPNGEMAPYEQEIPYKTFLHFDGITPPKFTFHGDDVILVRHRGTLFQENADVLQVGSTTIRLTTISLSSQREGYTHLLGYVKGVHLIVHDEFGYYTKRIGSWGAPTYTQLTTTETYTRPTYQNGQLYFLNDKGILTIENNQPHYVIWASDLSHHLEITYYEWNDHFGVFYANDFLRPRDFWVMKP